MKSKISLDETLERFNKKKSKEIAVNYLQHEITIIKKEIIELKNNLKNVKNDYFDLKQEMLILQIDKQLDNEQSDSEPDEQRDKDDPSQQAPLSNTALIDNRLNLLNKLIPPKWFSKVKIVVCHEYEFNVIAMIDSGADMNCIQEGIIPSKYYEKSTEKLFFANATQMKIKYKLNNAHICHDNVCFKIPYVLVKNMTDKVILGIPFINSLHPFLTEHDGITTDPFGQKVKFKFASRFEIDSDASLNLIHEPNI